MKVKQSGCISTVKDNIGSSNHYLITILVGLNEVEKDKNIRKPSFSPSWDPSNIKTTARLSREHVLNLSLAWIINGLDEYFKSLLRPPSIITDNHISKKLKVESIHEKLEYIREKCFLGNYELPLAMTYFAVYWRNNVIHSLNKKLPIVLRQYLKSKRKDIYRAYKNLNIDQLIDRYNDGGPLVQKGVGAFIKSVEDLIYIVDRKLLVFTDVRDYGMAIVSNHFKKYGQNISKTWDTTKKETLKRKRIIGILNSNHFETTNPEEFEVFFKKLNPLSVKDISSFK